MLNLNTSCLHSLQSQKGIGLILLFLAILAAGTVFILANSGPDNSRVNRENSTTASLARAKTALLAYASSYYLRQSTSGTSHAGIHGLLPCPEKASSPADGSSAPNCGTTHASSLGRFPWRSLDIQALTDASGECLWYAVSGGFFNFPKSSLTNDDTPGKFQIFNQNGSLHAGATPEDRVVAIILAPGLPLTGQTRLAATSGLPCKVSKDNVSAADYLDSHLGINNSIVDETNNDLIEQFINTSSLSDNSPINDRIITITSREIFDAIKKQTSLYDTKMLNLGVELSNCLINYSIATNDIVNPPSTCATDCDAARDLCLLNATTGRDRSACNKERNKCRKTCPASTGKGKGKGGGGGGGTTTSYQLPWPAAVDLGFADFRVNASYTDMDASTVNTQGHLGRLALDITNSNAVTGNSSVNNSFLDFCAISLTSESGLLWQHWKDHWFYVVGKDFTPGSTQASTTCTLCPKYQGNTNNYAAMLIFSDERIGTQLRRTNETENPDPAIANSKYSILNYLEGSNASNYIDTDGDKTYATYSVTDTPNDLLFCIPSDMSAVIGVCP